MSTSSSKNGRSNSGSRAFFRKVGALLASTALLVSTNLTTAALAEGQGGRGPAFQQFELNNPGVDRQELKMMFKEVWNAQKGGGDIGNSAAENAAQAAVNNVVNGAANSVNAGLVPGMSHNDFASKAEFKAYKDALKEQNMVQNMHQSIQQTEAGHIVRVNSGFSLDLTSAVESITLGSNLFKGQDAVSINVGGETKTVQAGSKVTAAEYVAAKQALVGGGQSVHLDADGRATGGTVDLSALTTGNKNMKVDDLVVPVAVTAAGDFGKGGDVRVNGDIVNHGSIVANGGNVTAWVSADNITNNAGASIVSNVDHLVLDADSAFANYGNISASGNLTIAGGNSVTNTGNVTVKNNLNVFSPNVTNSGNLASTKGDVTFDAIASNMNINNTNGTVSALNGAINVRESVYSESFNSTVTGGDLLSKEVNIYTGGGTTDVFVNELTGTVTSSGTAAHISADTSTLTIGNQCLVGDPTYFNSGDIVLNGSIVVGEALAIIAGGNITATANVSEITARDLAGQGYDINIVAGANIIAGIGPVGPVIPAIPPALSGATSPVIITGASATGGNIDFSAANPNLSINSSSTLAGANGGNLSLVAYANGTNRGQIILPSTSSINAGGGTNAVNGSIRVFGGNSVTLGAVTTIGGITGGQIEIANANPVFSTGGIMTFAPNGQVTSGNFFTAGSTPSFGNGGVTIGSISAIGSATSNSIRSGRNLLVTGSVFTNMNTDLRAGEAALGSVVVQGNVVAVNGISMDASGSITTQLISTGAGGNVVLDAGIDVSNGGINSNSGTITVNADRDVTVSGNIITAAAIDVVAGRNVVTGDVTSLGSSVLLSGDGNVTAANVSAGTSLTIAAGPNSFPAVNGNIVVGNLTAQDISLLAPFGTVTINGLLSASQTFTLSVLGDITNALVGGSVISAIDGVFLTSTIGSIGSASNQLLISANALSASANNGSVYINDLLSGPTVTVNSASGNVVQIVRTNPGVNGAILVDGYIGANTVILSNNGANGEVRITATGDIGGLGGGRANSVTLQATGIGRIEAVAGSLIDTIALTATAPQGQIVIDNTTASSISATSEGNVLITDSSTSTVTINALEGKIVDIELTTPGVGLIIANSIHATESLRLTTDDSLATASITRTGANTILVSPEIQLFSGGQIGTNTTAILTDTDVLAVIAGTSGPSGTLRNVFLSDSDSVAIDFIEGNIVNLSAVGSITNNMLSTQIRATTLNLSSTLGSIGELGVGTNGRIFTNASNISATAAGDLYLETNAPIVQVGVLSGQIIDVESNGSRFNLLENITGTTSVSIHTLFNNNFVNAITQLAGKTIITPVLSLSTTNGHIGTASNQIRTTAGLLDANTTGNVFLNATGDVSLNESSGDTFRLTSGGGITVLDQLSANNLTLTSGNNGNIDLQWFITGLGSTTANSVVLNANGSGNITQLLGTTINSASLALNSGSGDIGASGSPIRVANPVPNVNLSIHTTGDWFVSTAGDVNLGASTGGDGTLLASNVTTTGNTTLTGTLDITTLSLDVEGDKLAADIINVQSLPGGFNLNIDGGLAGGVFASTTKTNWIAADGGSIFLSGDMTMNGDTFITTNAVGQVTINAGAQYVGNDLVKITSGLVNQIGLISGNPLVYDLLGNTILNSNGDVNFSDNIIFVGENFAVLASGNINFSPFTNIRLANSAGDGGNLTLVAGYNITPSTVGQIRSTAPYTLGGASTSGGSINMGGTAFDLSGTNNGGSLVAIAQGQAGGNAGTVALGGINTSGANNGGSIAVLGSGGVSVGTINTTGGSASGFVALHVMNSEIVGGSIVITNGTRSGLGQFVGSGASAGNLSYGNITATGAEVELTGAHTVSNTITSTGTIIADTLIVQTGVGTATIGNTQFNTLNSNGDGTVSLSNIGNLVLDSIGGAGQSLTAIATGSITATNGFTINNLNLTGSAASGNAAITLAGAVASNSASLKSNGGGNILGDVSTNNLTLNSTGNVGVNASTRFITDAATIKVDAVNAFINDTNATGVAFSSGTVSGTFNILATGTVTGGTVTTSSAVITAAGIGTGTGANAFSITNGANPLSLEVHTGTGDSYINDIGTGALQIVGGSNGNIFDLTTPNGASVTAGGDLTFDGDINITTNSMTNAFDVASTNGSINIQSNAGSNLQIIGAASPPAGTYSAANGVINFTTNGTILGLSGNTTYLTTANLIANVSGQSVLQQAGGVSTATVTSYIYSASITGGSYVGPWNFVNSGTYANNGGNVVLTSITFSGADIAVIASGDIQLNNATINLSGNNGGNLTMLAGFNFDPNTFGQLDQDTDTTFQNFTPTSSGSILGTATINLDGAAGSGGRLIALANNGSVNLGNISSNGTVSGGDITIIASNGITTGSISTTGPTGGAIDLIVGNPTVGSGTNFQILGGSIITGANTVGNLGLNNGSISVGSVAAGNGTFSAQTSATGSVTLQNALSARDITVATGALNLVGFSTIAAGTDALGNAGDVSITAALMTSPTSHLQVTAIGTGAGSGGDINFVWNNAAAVSLGSGVADRFDFQFNASGTGTGGSANFTSQGDVTLNAGALVGNSTAAGAGNASVSTSGNLTVNANSINVGGTDGAGAQIALAAGIIDGVGVLNLADTAFFLQANGTGADGDGGLLSLIGSNITYAATSAVSPLALTAAGSGTGDGGTIIFRTGDTTATFVGSPAKTPKSPFHFLTANASGGGNGGTIDIEVGGNLTISDTSLVNASRGASGNVNGANYTFEAGKAATGNLVITGNLDASGLGSGLGGTILLGSNSKNAFAVTTANPKNGINGTLNGGEIQIINRNGGIQVQSAAALIAQRLNLSAASNGAISVVGTLTAPESIVLSAVSGAIGGKSAISVSTADLRVNTAGAVSINNLFAGPSVLQDSTGGAGFTLRTAGSTTLNDISTVKGNITVIESAGALQVANGSMISANSGIL